MTHIRERRTPKENLIRRRRQADLDMTDLMDIIQCQTGINYATVKHVVAKLFEVMKEQMMQDKTIDIDAFGTFGFKRLKEKFLPNIAKGNAMSYTPAHTTIKFKPDTRWASWHRMHSMEIPDQLPEGADYSIDIKLSKEGRRKAGITTPREELVKNKRELEFYKKYREGMVIKKQQESEK